MNRNPIALAFAAILALPAAADAQCPAIMFACAIKELEEAVDNKRPTSSLMK